MAQYDNRYAPVGTTRTEGAVVDQGLRSYMLGVYNYMAAALVLTGLVAYFIFTQSVTGDASLAAKTTAGGLMRLKSGMYLTQLGVTLFASPIKWVIMLAPLAFILAMSFARMSAATAQLVFWAFAAVMGLSLSTVFLVFKIGSITQMFFVTAAAFAGLSLFGYTTKKDMSAWGSFLIMGVIGILIAGIVNIFLQSSALQFAISAIGVLVFAGLTAYDTQRIKDEYYMVAGNGEAMATSSIFGALTLYLDFVNMFQFMLSLFGSRE